MQSCNKETDGPFRLSATIEKYKQGNKVHIETDNVGSYACWDVGDRLAINGVLSEVCQDDNGYYIQALNGRQYAWDQSHEEFFGLYPIHITRAGNGQLYGTTEVFLRPSEDYNVVGDAQKINAPMIAYMTRGNAVPDNDHVMQFKNVCALIKVNITNNSDASVGIERIEIVNSAEHPFWGEFQANVSASVQEIVEASNYADIASKIITKKATLNVNGQTTISNEATKSFYITVPAVEYSDLEITIITTDNKFKTFKGTVDDEFAANTIYSIGFEYTGETTDGWKTFYNTIDNDNCVNGVFSVSGSKTVKFAHGNLLSNGTTSTFATNQYDFKGYYGNLESEKDGFASSEVSSVPIPSGYDMLTSAEWDYLLSSNRGTYRYLSAMVNNIPGIILFPDGFSVPTGMTIHSYDLNSVAVSPSYNPFDLADWSRLEAAGCVFLPRINWPNIGSMSVAAYYWNKQEGDNARTSVNFGAWILRTNVDPSPNAPYVRLVKVVSSGK